MKILAIGNSFSEDATRYLHGIAKADGENLQVANLYIGGCSLEQHYRNMCSDEPAYEYQYNGQKTGDFVSLCDALRNGDWNVVTLQQASHFSFIKESYEPYISALMKFVRECVPNVKIYIHQTWAYENGSSRLLDFAKYETTERMLADVVQAYDEIAGAVRADGIIRSGEMLGTLLNKGISGIYRDSFHASLGLGRYALGLIWYHVLTGKKVCGNVFRDFDEPVSEDHIRIIQSTVESF